MPEKIFARPIPAVLSRKRCLTVSWISAAVLLLCSVSADAGPVIGQVASQTLTHGSVIAVTGSGFSVKPQAAPLKWQDFNGGTEGQQVVDYDSYWSQGNNPPMTISAENSRVGTSIKAVLKAGDPDNKASMIWRDNVGFAATGKIYLNYWVRMDFGTATTSGYFQVKNIEIAVGEDIWGNGTQIMPMLSINHFVYPGPPVYTQCLLGNYRSQFTIKADLTSGSAVLTNVDLQGHAVVEGMRAAGSGIASGTTIAAVSATTITLSAPVSASVTQSSVTISAPSDPTIYFPNNTFDRYSPSWQNVSLQAYMGTPGVADGSKWYWASSPGFNAPYVRVGADNRPILDAVAEKLNSIKIGWYRSNYEAGAIAAGTSTVQYDDIYIDNSWARVEIGDNADYGSCRHREIQVPVQWDDGNIQFRVNKGSFAENSAVYLFVVDENGAVSEGWGPLAVTGGAPVPAPLAPSGLLVE